MGFRFSSSTFPDVIAMIKVDKRPTPEFIWPIQLRPNRDNVLVFLPYEQTPEERYFNDMRDFMRKHKLFHK